MPDLSFFRRAAVDTSPLRHRDFRLLFWGQLVSFLGSQITYVAVPYQVYELTHSPLLVGMLGVAELIPVLALSMVGGAFADAHDRRRIVLTTEVAFAVLSSLLLLNALLPQPLLWAVFVLAAAQAGLFALQRPSMDALLPRLVEREDLVAAGALNGLRGTIGLLVGPAIGGVLIAVVGLPLTFGIDVVSFAASLVALAMMRAVPPTAGGERPSLRGVVDGLRFARSRPELIGTYVVDIVAMFFGMPQALFPAIAETMGGASMLGLLYSAPGLGAFAAMATSGWTGQVRRHGLAVIVAAMIWGLAIVGFGVCSGLGPGAVAAAAVGGGALADAGAGAVVGLGGAGAGAGVGLGGAGVGGGGGDGAGVGAGGGGVGASAGGAAAVGGSLIVPGLGLVGVQALAIATLAIAGGADAISGIFRQAIWNQTVPDALRGRLASIEMLSYSSGPLLGNAESGLVAGAFGVPLSVISGGVLCVLGCIACGIWLPKFRAYDARARTAPVALEGVTAD